MYKDCLIIYTWDTLNYLLRFCAILHICGLRFKVVAHIFLFLHFRVVKIFYLLELFKRHKKFSKYSWEEIKFLTKCLLFLALPYVICYKSAQRNSLKRESEDNSFQTFYFFFFFYFLCCFLCKYIFFLVNLVCWKGYFLVFVCFLPVCGVMLLLTAWNISFQSWFMESERNYI